MSKEINKLIKDLVSDDWHTRKHALWMMGRFVQRGDAKTIVRHDIYPILKDCISDPDETICYRAIWVIGVLAEKGEGKELRNMGVIQLLENKLNDNTEASICKAYSGELEWTTIGELARNAIEKLEAIS